MQNKEVKTFLHSGGLGDIIYSLPTIKALGGGIVYVKPHNHRHPYGNLYELMKDILLAQDYILDVRPYVPDNGNWEFFQYRKDTPIDYDLDLARLQKKRGLIHIVKRHLDAFNVDLPGWQNPWLQVDDFYPMNEDYTLIHLTERWRGDMLIDWTKVLHSIKGKVYFIGFTYEHLDFTIRHGHIEHLQTDNIIHMARLVRDCKALYCNQSVALTIAQGLGKEYYLEQKPSKTNCLLLTPNENILCPNLFRMEEITK